MATAIDVFPELLIRADDVELRPMRWTDFPSYADIMVAGLLTPSDRPALGPWYDVGDRCASARRAIAGHLVGWADLNPDEWTLGFGIFDEGRLVGSQVLKAEQFLERREASTESLLSPRHRGRGLGTLARVAVLHLAFDVLGAVSVTAASFPDNAASVGVSRQIGYRDEGFVDVEYADEAFRLHQWRIDAATWQRERKRWAVSATGTAGLRSALGLASAAAAG